MESSKTNGKSIKAGTELVRIPIDMLYEGLSLSQDIYDINGDVVLLYRDSTLDKEQLDKLKNYGKSANTDSVSVSVKIYRGLMERYLSCKISDPEELEAKSGYADMVVEMRSMADYVRLNEEIPHDIVGRLSEMIIKILGNMSYGDILDLVNIPADAEAYFSRHSVNAALLSGLIGKWMGLSEGDVNFLSLVGLLHDCGKLVLPDSIIKTSRSLTYVEFEVVKMHSIYGYELLSEYSDGVKYGVRDHHERLDAGGYPDGIAGGSVSLAARVVSIADLYAAIVANRPWRAALSPFHALSHLEAFADIKFDSDIVEIFKNNILEQLQGRPVQLSDGTLGVVEEMNSKDLEYPYVRIGGLEGNIVKTYGEFFCEGIYFGPIVSE
ncbi:MAG: HD-GYP domain-containing protein [Defluviitaleaceae bacterium]|nr:HD-GYP domain-containing protein [Defluviitaleaceae bacterium]